ncbi:uncharacterized protein LOC129279142 [Lytechinus pictus]|uniref:uncharacterized protein LOC129279142 n=1 Tax=Lytechinus pictus TaxID=7653 RepID=UPI0030BA0961
MHIIGVFSSFTVDFHKVPRRHRKPHSPLIKEEPDVELRLSRTTDAAFDNVDNIETGAKSIPPSTSGIDSKHEDGLVGRLRGNHHRHHHRHHHQRQQDKWDQLRDKKVRDKERTLKSTRTDDYNKTKLLKDDDNIEKAHQRIRHGGTGRGRHDRTSAQENIDSKVHHKRGKRDGPGAPLPPSHSLATHPPPPIMDGDPPWMSVPPPSHFPYQFPLGQVADSNGGNPKTQTTRMPTTCSTDHSSDESGSAVSHLYGTTRWTLSLAILLSLAIHILL